MRAHSPRTRVLLVAVLALVALVAASCGDDDDPAIAVDDTAADDGGGSTELTVVAEDVSFDVTELEAPAGEEVTVTFEHRDDGVQHNFHVQAGDAGDFKTDIESGPVTQTLTFTIDEPGTYPYVCDVHPGQMQGTLVVS